MTFLRHQENHSVVPLRMAQIKNLEASIFDLGHIILDQLWFTAKVEGEIYENISLEEARDILTKTLVDPAEGHSLPRNTSICTLSVKTSNGRVVEVELLGENTGFYSRSEGTQARTYRYRTLKNLAWISSSRVLGCVVEGAIAYLYQWLCRDFYVKGLEGLSVLSDNSKKSSSYFSLLTPDVVSYVVAPFVSGLGK